MSLGTPNPERVFAGTLTKREREVLALVALGYSNKEVGELLYVGHETIRTHMKNVLIKLNVRTRAAAVYRGIEEGWLSTPSPESTNGPSRARARPPAVGWRGEPDALLRRLGRDSR